MTAKPSPKPHGAAKDRRDEAHKPRARRQGPIVPSSSVSGHTLVIVIAIMTYLAALTVGAVDLVRATAAGWEADVMRETTIQIRPAEGRDLDALAARAIVLARAARGVVDVRPYSDDETARLLEPWLGSGLSFDDLPIPRLVVLRLSDTEPFDPSALRSALEKEVPGATLDDHRRFLDRLVAMANTLVGLGLGVLALVLTATVLSVVFATRGAMAGNRDIVQVLHFVGARDGYIAGQFQRRFLRLGLKGGLAGGVAAVATFLIAEFSADQSVGTAAADQIDALFGNFQIGPTAYAGVAAIVAVIAILTALTSRATVYRTLRTFD
ncbi:cell division protein FtsX [Methylopila turkensis]|uniref:Cell division protein FtsX n=1 Tax=Methylopila turkensis TaxID=1437816 RepID=A0A9W6N7C9_9HYPH|nr:ABC transporter permease [Methylopila turkensis]GLK80231.1 cell division protein FtsX [Methylopila turkensis]